MKINNDIKQTFRVARIELYSMFYSPVAWLVLVIFAFQIGNGFYESFGGILHTQELGNESWLITSTVFTNMFTGIFPPIFKNLYLYIPLLTMGLMSREYHSGSIKLLYSSPIKNSSIILGKFLTMAIYGLALVGIILIPILLSLSTVNHFELNVVLVALIGVYLLILAYSAIGIFMSSITKYQVVAAIGTFGTLAALNYLTDISLNNEILRNIIYWLGISGRTSNFKEGLLPSHDVAYFLIVIALFLSLSIFKLNTEKSIMHPLVKVSKYCVIVLCAFLFGYITSNPYFKYYYDATYTQSNTLSIESQNVIKNIKGPLKITTYVNMIGDEYISALPCNRNFDLERYEKYIRFKPDITMEYVFYYDKTDYSDVESRFPNMSDKERAEAICDITGLNFKKVLSPQEISKIIDLKPEANRFIRVVENDKGEKAVLRLFNDRNKHPFEEEITAALKKFAYPSIQVAFLDGYGAREIDNYGGRGYYFFVQDKWFRQSLVNHGFQTRKIDLDQEDMNNDIEILVISDLQGPLSENASVKVKNYLDKGGNLFILGDYQRGVNLNQIMQSFGVKFSDGILVKESEYTSPTVLAANFTKEAVDNHYFYKKEAMWGSQISAPTSLAINYSEALKNGYKISPILSVEDSWVERETIDFVDGEFICNESVGEHKGTHDILIHLSRKIGDKEQRIVVSGDADCISNGEMSLSRPGMRAANYSIISSSFRWLSGDKYPINTERKQGIDNGINLPDGSRKWVKYVFVWIIPLVLVFTGYFIVSRRKRK